jgi:hypothetical protein
MTTILPYSFPRLRQIPNSIPAEGSIRIEVVEGIPIFRSTKAVQERIQTLLQKKSDYGLTTEEIEELDWFEEIDDYLSFFNRMARNHLESSPRQDK